MANDQLRTGPDIAILALGAMVLPAERAADLLAADGIDATVVNARFAKPLDERLILDLVDRCGAIVTVEENVRAGGFGSAVLEFLSSRGLTVPTRVLAAPDRVFEQASQGRLRDLAGLSAAHVSQAARELGAEKRDVPSPSLLAVEGSVG